jgi:hypothetical protein
MDQPTQELHLRGRAGTRAGGGTKALTEHGSCTYEIAREPLIPPKPVR